MEKRIEIDSNRLWKMAGTPADLRGVTEAIAAEQRAARAAGLTSRSFPSSRPIGSVLDDVSAKPERAKVLGVQRVRNLLAHASHFLLDEDAGARVVDMVENNGPLISDLLDFAIRPFDRMTLSVPTRATRDTEREVLMLLDKYQDINAFALVLRNTRDGSIAPIPGWYAAVRHRHGEAGRTVLRLDDAMPNDEMMRYAIGTYSLAIDAVMLFLNQKKGVHISEPTPARRTLRGGRPVQLVKRSTIHLTLDAPAELRHHHATATRGPVRRHGVRGHFFHRGGDLACVHRWARLDGWENAWECVDCDRRRFWRRDFERGDIEKGIAVARYAVHGA